MPTHGTDSPAKTEKADITDSSRKTTRPVKLAERTLDARPDTLDFRDRMYMPTLVEVPSRIPLDEYLAHQVPILDQGTEGACTGFGLSTVANYLLHTRKVDQDCTPVSPRMMYEMARRYDEWPGENYSGSSARGAMKGWHKHGVCADKHWPYDAGAARSRLNQARTADALKRPLGSYYRVNHRDLVAMHASLAEVGILYATATVHQGWDKPGSDGHIAFSDRLTGGHAFAIVAYDEQGFWIQNSWGKDWGKDGFACVSYDDWLQNGTDVWVARLGVPVLLRRSTSSSIAHSASAGQSVSYSYADLRPHLISIGNDGRFKPGGDYGTGREDIEDLFDSVIPEAIDAAGYKHLLLYAHGGLVSSQDAVQRLADYRSHMLDAGIYPVSFIWHTDFWTTLKHILQDAFSRRRPEGLLDAAKDFMLDRLDDSLEPLARSLLGKSAWDEMKENALRATGAPDGGARHTCMQVARLCERYPQLKVHIVGHSAGSIFLAPMVSALNRADVAVESATLWAPACTIDLFKQHYLPAIETGDIKRFSVFVLSDNTEQDDHCARIYNKSLLYLVSNAFEEKRREPWFGNGEAILGMQKFLDGDAELKALFKRSNIDMIVCPNSAAEGSSGASRANSHGAFDDDGPTVKATLRRILDVGTRQSKETLLFHRSASSLGTRRRAADLSNR